MRVAIVGDYPVDTSQVQGGVQAAFAYLVKGLSQIEDLEVHIVTMGGPDLLGFDRVERNGVTVHVLPVYPRFELARRYRTYQSRLNARLAEIKPDVVHAQDAGTDAYVALRSGYPTVLTLHGIQHKEWKHKRSLLRQARNRFYSLLIERDNLKRTRHLIAISHYVVDSFSAQLSPDVRAYYVPNAIDEGFFELADTSDGHTILYAGAVILRKRPLDLVQAFAQVARQEPAAQLRMAGESKSELSYGDMVRDTVTKEGLGDRVHMLGQISEDAVLREFSGCDLLALPSAQETTPMVIAQAMAAGKPVVTTPVGGIPDMVRDGETGLLVGVGDKDGLAEALLRLLRDPTLRAQMGKLGREFAIENYRVDHVARRTYEVYQQVAAAS